MNSFIRTRLVYGCQNWNVSTQQCNRIDVTYRKFLRRMVRGGFKFVDRENNDYRYIISNARLHQICGTSDVSHFINSQQRHYAFHVIRMNASRSLKMLAFNDDQYKKKGRPIKSLIDPSSWKF